VTYRPHTRFTFSGAVIPGEVWSCSLNFASDVVGEVYEPGGLPGLATAAASRWKTLHEGITAMSFSTTFTQVAVRNIDAAGRTTAQAFAGPVDATVGNSTPALPPQCCVVASLQTAEPGPRGRGRIYLPLIGGTVTNGARLAPLVRDDVAQEVKTLLNSLKTYMDGGFGGPYFPVVASAVGSGFNYPVDRVRVGDVIDTQRRRRDGLTEAYAVQTL
jgi:hypothetical protein